MSLINSLLSPIGSMPVRPVGGTVGQLRPEVRQPGTTGAVDDRFTQGEWWRHGALNAAGEPVIYTRQQAGGGTGAGNAAQGAATTEDSQEPQPDSPTDSQDDSQARTTAGVQERAPDGRPLSAREIDLLRQLRQADSDVRAHEQAHLAAAGGYATGGASFTYRQGPDGKRYAVAGEVPIDISKESAPEATINKMRVVRRAALAPRDPSPQDQKVAAQATINIAEAMSEMQAIDAQARAAGRRDMAAAGQDGAPNREGGVSEASPIPPSPVRAAASYAAAGAVAGGLELTA